MIDSDIAIHIAALLTRKRVIDSHSAKTLNMESGAYDAWAIEALALLLRVALEHERRMHGAKTSRETTVAQG